ncbi:MAG: PA14 domain-containing protein [Cyanobacteria bacterium J06639_14]
MKLDNIPDSMRGLQASFYNDRQPVFNQNDLTTLQDFYTVSQLDLDWGDRAPGTDVPGNNFSAVFEGKLVADQSGTQDYTLYLNTANDEGVRLYVGDEKLIDTWNNPRSGELKTTVSLTAGEAEDIRLEYKEGTGEANLKLEWEADGLAREVIPEENFVRHGYGAVNEDDLLTIRVATNGSEDFEIVQNPTEADHDAIEQHTFASIQDAVDQAEALMNTGQGVKILVEPGKYRVSDYGKNGIVLGDSDARNAENFELNEQGREATLVIEGTGPGVEILGSEQWQDGWQHLGNGVYKHEWTEDWGFEVQMPSNPPMDPITHRREAVFVDGERLEPVLFQETTYNRSADTYSFGKKIDPVEDLENGQFTVDEDGDAIYMKLPQGKTTKDSIEVAQAEQLFRSAEPNNNLVLRNLEFSHASNRYARDYAFGAVDIGPSGQKLGVSDNIVIDNVSVQDNSGTGLRLRNTENVTVSDSSFNHNGASGISTRNLDGVLFKGVDTEYNNWRGELGGYQGWFVAGIKNHYIENVTADDFNASNNYSHGYWHDLNAKNTLFVNGTTENNTRHGIFIEVSDGTHQVIDSVSRNNGESGVMINTSPNVLLQGNAISNNGGGGTIESLNPTDGGDRIEGEIRIGARVDREANEPELPDVVDNVTLIDNVVQNTSDSTTNELIALYGNSERYQNLLQNELAASHNVYWDATEEPNFALRYDKNVQFSEADNQGDRWLDVSNRENFETGSTFERPQPGNVKPQYTGSFASTLAKGEDIVLSPDQIGVSDSDSYAFDLTYTLTNEPKQGSLRLRGVALNKDDSFSLADVERGWVSYTHETNNQTDDALQLRASDGKNQLAAKTLSFTIGDKDETTMSKGVGKSATPPPQSAPEPKPESEPEPKAELEPEPAPAPQPKPKSEPVPEPEPTPEPEAELEPTPKPTPKPQPKSEPVPEPEPTPEPEAELEPTPKPQPVPEPEPAPEPDLIPESEPTPEAESVPTSGLVAELNLNATSGDVAVDSSRQGRYHKGKLRGDATWTDGIDQGGVAFDGENDVIRLNNSRDINRGIHSERTISLWFKANELLDSGNQKQVIYEEGGHIRGLNIYIEQNQLYVGGWNTPSAESDWQGTWLKTDDFSTNQWNHVALVLEGDDTLSEDAFQAYLNGEKFGEGEGSQLWEHGAKIGLGSIHDRTRFHDGLADRGHGLDGAIDQVMIYNNALSNDQIQTLSEPV